MSASLVGSEMCIRDSIYSGLCHAFATKSRHENEVIECTKLLSGDRIWTVSYTHLTLPTICSV
eukprot:6910164-Alexandrium_andersonii.AAC.1